MIIAGLIALVVLQVADLVTTHLFLKHGVREANPLMRWLLERAGFWPLIAAKIVVTAALIAFVLAYPEIWLVLAAAIVIQAYVVGANLMTLDVL